MEEQEKIGKTEKKAGEKRRLIQVECDFKHSCNNV